VIYIFTLQGCVQNKMLLPHTLRLWRVRLPQSEKDLNRELFPIAQARNPFNLTIETHSVIDYRSDTEYMEICCLGSSVSKKVLRFKFFPVEGEVHWWRAINIPLMTRACFQCVPTGELTTKCIRDCYLPTSSRQLSPTAKGRACTRVKYNVVSEEELIRPQAVSYSKLAGLYYTRSILEKGFILWCLVIYTFLLSLPSLRRPTSMHSLPISSGFWIG
jgi:hypothetical protein